MGSAGKHLDSLVHAKVLVVGDVMLDRYWFGDVDRISPEAPVPVVSVTNCDEKMGGAGNVAVNIASLGGQCTLLAIVGDDDAGATLEQLATQSGINHTFVVDSVAPTSIKQRIVSRNQQLIRADFEGLPDDLSISILENTLTEQLSDHDIVIISDYGKGAVMAAARLIALSRAANTPVFVDPKGADFSRYAGSTMITPNLNEFELVVGTVQNDQDMQQKANQIISEHNVDSLLITLSERGMILFEQDESFLHSPARSREVYDVSGAGDTVIAVMAMSMATGLQSKDALSIANSAAGVVVSKLGTATTSMEELRRAMVRDAVQ